MCHHKTIREQGYLDLGEMISNVAIDWRCGRVMEGIGEGG